MKLRKPVCHTLRIFTLLMIAEMILLCGCGFLHRVVADVVTVDTYEAYRAPSKELIEGEGGKSDTLCAPTPEYAIKEEKIIGYKDKLNANDCQEINLSACAAWLFAIDECDGFQTGGLDFDYNKTILSNYLGKEQVFEFGRTGKGLDVIYFKDEKGKKTKEPALLYLNVSDLDLGLNAIQKSIDLWERDAPGFLRVMVKNDVRILFQNKANNQRGENAQYEDGVIFYNCGKIDARSTANHIKTLRNIFGVEQFGMRGQALFPSEYWSQVAVIKGTLARDCCKYLAKKTKSSFYKDRATSYQMEVDNYTKIYYTNPDEIRQWVEKIRSENLYTPYGAKTWEEIDSANN